MKNYLIFETLLKQSDLDFRKEVMLNEIIGANFKHKHRSDYCIFINDRAACIIEIEGGTFQQGRHNQGIGYHNDCLKYNCLQVFVPVLRFTSQMINKQPVKIVEFIKKFVENNLNDEYLSEFMNEFKLR